MIDLLDVARLVIAAGFSTALFMGFWFLWLKTKNPGLKICAFFFGSIPITVVGAALLARVTIARGTVHQFEAFVAGGKAGEGVYQREVAFPVEDPELRHVVELRPALAQVELKGPNGEAIEVQLVQKGNSTEIEFDARGGGQHVAVLKIPDGVIKVSLIAKEIR